MITFYFDLLSIKQLLCDINSIVTKNSHFIYFVEKEMLFWLNTLLFASIFAAWQIHLKVSLSSVEQTASDVHMVLEKLWIAWQSRQRLIANDNITQISSTFWVLIRHDKFVTLHARKYGSKLENQLLFVK